MLNRDFEYGLIIGVLCGSMFGFLMAIVAMSERVLL